MKKNIVIDNKWLWIIKTILIISCPFFTFMLSNNYDINLVILGSFFSFVIFAFILLKFKLNYNINKKYLLFYIIISCYIITNALSFANKNGSFLENIKLLSRIFSINPSFNNIIIGLLAFPVTLFFVKLFHEFFFDKIFNFFKKLTLVEKRFLYIVLFLSIIISFIVVNCTTVFSRPDIDYDVFYTTDSGSLLKNNVYLDVSSFENDVRQPLFGIFSLPFGLVANAISKLCFFFRDGYEFETVMTIFQFLLLALTTLMLARLLKISEERKKYFYLIVSCSFPYILFSLVLEQYVIALFYLILAFYYYFEHPEKVNYVYVGAVGTLVTSGIIFPLISKFKNIKQWIMAVFRCFFAFIATMAIGGQIPQIFISTNSFIFFVSNFADGHHFIDKLYQYTGFVRGLFFTNPGGIGSSYDGIIIYKLLPHTSIDWIGVIILILCLVSFLLNRKNKMALISMLWVAFSMILLLFVGWGTVENGLILYSIYFAWAFHSLIFLLFDKVINNKKMFKISIVLLFLIMMVANICEFFLIFRFAIKYY